MVSGVSGVCLLTVVYHVEVAHKTEKGHVLILLLCMEGKTVQGSGTTLEIAISTPVPVGVQCSELFFYLESVENEGLNCTIKTCLAILNCL